MRQRNVAPAASAAGGIKTPYYMLCIIFNQNIRFKILKYKFLNISISAIIP